MEANMIMCIHMQNGDKKPFPKETTKMPFFVSTGYRVMSDEEEALYLSSAKLREEGSATPSSGKPEISEQGKKDFEKFVKNQKTVAVLEQSKTKFTEDWQKALIDERIKELTPAEPELKAESKTETK